MNLLWILLSVLAASCAANACDMGGGSLAHPAQGEIYKQFGYMRHPLLNTTRLHTGIDYRGQLGTPVPAAGAGTVVAAAREGGYGNFVPIDHGNGLQTSYAHLREIEVKPGQCIGKGEIVGGIGETGLATEPHLHFEIMRDNHFVDPMGLLPARTQL
jgi:murein DD-endopeptidase MepM/ murein hydrolase activator NlpD